jgi:hypothetical protein
LEQISATAQPVLIIAIMQRLFILPYWTALLLLAVCSVFLSPLAFATLSAGSVALAWDANPEPDIATYVLYYGTVSGDYSDRLEVGTGTNATLQNLAPGTTYYCAVSARNSRGVESSLSNEVSFATDHVSTVEWLGLADRASFNGGTSIPLRAAASPDVARLEYYTGNAKIGEAPASGTALSWQPSAAGTHTLTVRGLNSSGQVVQTAAITVHVVQPQITLSRRRRDGAWELAITGAPGRMQHVYASSDLKAWTRVSSKVNESGTINYTDRQAATAAQRFYKVESE